MATNRRQRHFYVPCRSDVEGLEWDNLAVIFVLLFRFCCEIGTIFLLLLLWIFTLYSVTEEEDGKWVRFRYSQVQVK